MHIYKKAGFKMVGDFLMPTGVFAGQKTMLMIKNI